MLIRKKSTVPVLFLFMSLCIFSSVPQAFAGEILPFPNGQPARQNYSIQQSQSSGYNTTYRDQFIGDIAALNCDELHALKQKLQTSMDTAATGSQAEAANYFNLITTIDKMRETKNCK